MGQVVDDNGETFHVCWQQAKDTNGITVIPRFSLDLSAYFPTGGGPADGPSHQIDVVQVEDLGEMVKMKATVRAIQTFRIFVQLDYQVPSQEGG